MNKTGIGSFSIDSLMAPSVNPRFGQFMCNGYMYVPPVANHPSSLNPTELSLSLQNFAQHPLLSSRAMFPGGFNMAASRPQNFMMGSMHPYGMVPQFYPAKTKTADEQCDSVSPRSSVSASPASVGDELEQTRENHTTDEGYLSKYTVIQVFQKGYVKCIFLTRSKYMYIACGLCVTCSCTHIFFL